MNGDFNFSLKISRGMVPAQGQTVVVDMYPSPKLIFKLNGEEQAEIEKIVRGAYSRALGELVEASSS